MKNNMKNHMKINMIFDFSKFYVLDFQNYIF